MPKLYRGSRRIDFLIRSFFANSNAMSITVHCPVVLQIFTTTGGDDLQYLICCDIRGEFDALQLILHRLHR